MEKLSRNSVIEPGLYSNSIIIAKNEEKHRGEYREGPTLLSNQFHYQDYIILLVRYEIGRSSSPYDERKGEEEGV